MECTDEGQIIQSLTDKEIINSVLNQQDLNSDTESEEEIKITHEESLAVGYKYFEFHQKQNYVSEQEVTIVQRLKIIVIINQTISA